MVEVAIGNLRNNLLVLIASSAIYFESNVAFTLSEHVRFRNSIYVTVDLVNELHA
jgi:hypothetical protein